VIVEVGRLPPSAFADLCHQRSLAGLSSMHLRGEGWGDELLAVDCYEELRLPLGSRLAEAASALDALPCDEVLPSYAGAAPAPLWIGYIAYECARDLERADWAPVETRADPIGCAMVLRRHAAIARRCRASGMVAVEGDDPASVRSLVRALSHLHPSVADLAPSKLSPRAVDDDAHHEARVRAALDLIGRGDAYQVCLARTFESHVGDDVTPASLLHGMNARTPAAFAASLDFEDHAVVSASPELFLSVSGRTVRTQPIKGTRPRGQDREGDAIEAALLESDAKERAELAMIVDLMRSDLGRVAKLGSVRVEALRAIRPMAGVHHAFADIAAELRADVGLGELVGATFPGGSVTGAPKIRAMEIIAKLESHRRGGSCGALLAIDGRGGLRAAMTIRTLFVEGQLARWHVGGGIVEASDPAREALETHWKSLAVRD